MSKIEIEITTQEELKAVLAILEKGGLKYEISGEGIAPKKESIFEIIEKLPKSNIDPNIDLKEQYYKDKAKKYGFNE